MKQLPIIQPPATAVPGTEGCCAGDDCCADTATSTAPATASASVTAPSPDALRSVLRIDGMDCASCATTLERVVASLDGVERAVVNFAAARLDVHHVPSVDHLALDAAVRRAGFRVRPTERGAPVRWWRQPGVVGMVAACALAAGAIAGDVVAPSAWWAVCFAAAIVTCGRPIFRAAYVAIRARHLDMNVLMAAATIGAGILGEWIEATAIVLLFAIGTSLQVHAIARTREAVAQLSTLAPDTVRVRRGAAELEVAVDDVAVGDEVIVLPGDRLAVDGVVVEGASTVDESSVTGEGVPVEKTLGDAVLSGTRNGSAAIVVQTLRIARESTLQRVVELVERAQATKAPAELFVDRFSRIYTPVVVVSALVLMVAPPLLSGDWSTWAYRGLALLIIACPCSLVISTPVTIVSAIGAASRRGILVKGGEALEAAGRVRAIAFDKTGTLTEGRPTLATTTTFSIPTADDCLRIAASLERRSEHPLAHAILSAVGADELAPATGLEAVAGRGAIGWVDGVEYVIGSPRLFRERGVLSSPEVEAALELGSHSGETPVLLGTGGAVLALFGLVDTIRPEAAGAIADLRNHGIRTVVMLTGDSEGAARRVATELGIEYRAGLLPQDKVDAVHELIAAHGVVGMVGDGVNDAPALATASVSYAMGAAGSGVALEAADITLMADDLRSLAGATRLSRAAHRVLRQNIIASILFKGGFVLLAPFGLVTLWVAVLADLGTSLAVTVNGLRLFRSR